MYKDFISFLQLKIRLMQLEGKDEKRAKKKYDLFEGLQILVGNPLKFFPKRWNWTLFPWIEWLWVRRISNALSASQGKSNGFRHRSRRHNLLRELMYTAHNDQRTKGYPVHAAYLGHGKSVHNIGMFLLSAANLLNKRDLNKKSLLSECPHYPR